MQHDKFDIYVTVLALDHDSKKIQTKNKYELFIMFVSYFFFFIKSKGEIAPVVISCLEETSKHSFMIKQSLLLKEEE